MSVEISVTVRITCQSGKGCGNQFENVETDAEGDVDIFADSAITQARNDGWDFDNGIDKWLCPECS